MAWRALASNATRLPAVERQVSKLRIVVRVLLPALLSHG
jgi:hypothetical protein